MASHLYILCSQKPICRLFNLYVVINKVKGTYFGPFLHKNDARQVYYFLKRILNSQCATKKLPMDALIIIWADVRAVVKMNLATKIINLE